MRSCTLENKKHDVQEPNPREPPWGGRYPPGHGFWRGPPVASSQLPRPPFHWKKTAARLGAEGGKSLRLPRSHDVPNKNISRPNTRFFDLLG